ncbi:MAG: ImmA/IrrE family metallo-endopeptidase, partial [Candidatus Dadabacteria bacterium]|nr:ImmA/IrrE family metallo-endopeptidase [Candidatus Dadabacteria bacterium]
GTVSKYEVGILPISDDDLIRLSTVLDYPPHFFSLRVSIEGPSISESFHRKRQSISALILHQVYALAEIRRIEIQKLLKSFDETKQGFPKFPIDEYDDDVEKVARTVRAQWQIPPGPVNNVTKIIEKERAVIFEYDLGTRQIDGFSHRSDNMPPMFFLNKDVPPDRWRWTLAHELGHIIMHFDVDRPAKVIEEQADRFAGEFLAPGNELKPQLMGLDFPKLAGLKRYWKISMAALVMRAYHLKAITDNQRRNMFMRLSKAGYRLREPAVTDPPIETPGLPYRLVQYHLNKRGHGQCPHQLQSN